MWCGDDCVSAQAQRDWKIVWVHGDDKDPLLSVFKSWVLFVKLWLQLRSATATVIYLFHLKREKNRFGAVFTFHQQTCSFPAVGLRFFRLASFVHKDKHVVKKSLLDGFACWRLHKNKSVMKRWSSSVVQAKSALLVLPGGQLAAGKLRMP